MLPIFSGKNNEVESFIRVGDLIFAQIPDTVDSEALLIQAALSKLTKDAQFLYKNGSSWKELTIELRNQFKTKLREILNRHYVR